MKIRMDRIRGAGDSKQAEEYVAWIETGPDGARMPIGQGPTERAAIESALAELADGQMQFLVRGREVAAQEWQVAIEARTSKDAICRRGGFARPGE